MVARTRFLARVRALVGLYLLILMAHFLPRFLPRAPFPALPVWAVWGFPVVGVGLAAAALALERRRHREVEERVRSGPTMLLLPRAEMATPKTVSLWARLAEILPPGEHLAWEVSGGSDRVVFSFRAAADTLPRALAQVTAEWPGVQARRVEPENDPVRPPEGAEVWWVELAPQSADRPIETSGSEPLLAVLTEIARLPEGVRAGVQILARGDPVTRSRLGARAVRHAASRDRSERERSEGRRMAERASRLFLEVRLLVWASARTRGLAQVTARALAGALAAQFGPSNPIRRRAEGAGSLETRAFPLFAGMPWADTEIGLIGHLLGKDGLAVAPQMRVAPARPLPPSPECRVPSGARVALRRSV